MSSLVVSGRGHAYTRQDLEKNIADKHHREIPRPVECMQYGLRVYMKIRGFHEEAEAATRTAPRRATSRVLPLR